MTGVRLDRFLASTALVLVLSAGGGALAGPAEKPDAAQSVPSAAVTAPADDGAAPAAKTDDDADDQTEAATPPAAIDNANDTTAPTPNPAAAQEGAIQDGAAQDKATADKPAQDSAEQPVAPAAAATPPTTPAPQAPAPTASAAADNDGAVAAQLRELANGKFDRVIGGKKERAAIDAFYSARNYAPLWITDGKANARATAAIAYLGHVDADGLDPSDYPVPNFTALSDPAALADAEMKLSASVITYAHHAAIGRVHWTRVSADISYEQKAPEGADVLAAMAQAKDVGLALDGYEPHYRDYVALKAKLAELRGGKEEAGKTPIPDGPALKIGAPDDRVPQLRARLGLPDEGNTNFDKPLSEALKKFQREYELKPTGTLTSGTLEALNGKEPERPVDTILANMERWRWMPHELGDTFVMVNLADFRLHVMHDGKEVWTTRIVDGKPAMPTPIMSAEMKYITVNPTWNVPPSIVAREYMPALRQDPTVLERMGLTVTRNPDGTVHIAQPPGDRNALGRVRFNFPNKFLVYQHDTPEKYLFAYDKRAYSHGCMRVQDPVKYAEVLLSLVRPGEGYTQDRIRKMFGNNEQDIQFPKFLPVHLTYQTAFVDERGDLQFRDDVYGRDKALIAILKSDERKVADIPIERKENTIRREVLALPDQPSLWGGHSLFGGGPSDGGGFFSRLFGSQAAAPPPPPQRKQRRTELRQ
jgi:murein L,D-transpeptidase YcbB/YkuD